jgi:hypothetical protein
VPSERCSNEQSIEYCGWAFCVQYRGAWLLIMYGSSYMFRHYITILRERSYCFLRDVQMSVVSSNVVRGDHHTPRYWKQHAYPQYSTDCSPFEHLLEGTRNAP